MKPNRLFHISEDSNIKVFKPRPSPSLFESINGAVVFAITDTLLHNYLLPRECPRVTFYSKVGTTKEDKEKFFGTRTSHFVVAIESKWYEPIKQTTLYCYEFPTDTFVPLDDGAGYYISYKEIIPDSMKEINDIISEFLTRNAELRIMSNLLKLAKEVSASSLQYSLIRMRNAIKQDQVYIR